MQSHDSRCPLNIRALLDVTCTPFSVAEYGQREVIFFQGDPCDSVLHVETGRVCLAVTARSGQQAICGLVGTGAFLGEEALAGQAVRRHTATTLTATRVLVMAKAQTLRLLHTQPAIAERLIAHILARHGRLEADLTDQLLHRAEQRLARALLVLAGCGEGARCRCTLPNLSQEIIAEMVGTTRSRVNAFIGKLRKLGFIEKDGERLRVTPSLVQVIHS